MRLLSSIEFVLLAQVGMTNDLTKRKENFCRREFYIAYGEIEIGGKVGSWLNLKMESNSFFFFQIFHHLLLHAIIAVIVKFDVHTQYDFGETVLISNAINQEPTGSGDREGEWGRESLPL